MEAFSVTTQITRQNYSMLVLRKMYKQIFVLVLTTIGTIMLITAILELMNVINIYSGTPTFQLIFGIFTLMLPVITFYQSKKNYDTSKHLHHDMIYTFTQDNITVHANNFDSTFKWNNIIKMEEIGNYLLLYSGKTVANIINKDKLSTAQIDYIKLRSEQK